MILLCLFIKNSPQNHLVSILSSHAVTQNPKPPMVMILNSEFCLAVFHLDSEPPDSRELSKFCTESDGQEPSI